VLPCCDTFGLGNGKFDHLKDALLMRGSLRSGWTRFILSLLFRNPEAVATIKGHILNMWAEGIKALQSRLRRTPQVGRS
jgi:hypothetical protein